MNTPNRNKSRLENSEHKAFVDDTFMAMDHDDEDEDTEDLELAEIGVLEVRESSEIPLDWGRVSGAPAQSAMVLYPKPRPPREADALETVISSLPAMSASRAAGHSRRLKALSYVLVSAASILGTWLVMKGSDAPPAATPSPEIITNEATIGEGDVPKKAGVATSPIVPLTSLEVVDEEIAPIAAPFALSDESDEGRALEPTTAPPPPNGVEPRAPVSSKPKIDGPRASARASDLVSRDDDTTETEQETVEEKPVAAAALLIPDEKGTSLPQMPDKQLVRSTMESLRDAVQQCKGNISGRVIVEVVVSGNTGRVISSKAIDQVEVGAKTGRCAARAVETARFPRFTQTQLTIKYPYDL